MVSRNTISSMLTEINTARIIFWEKRHFPEFQHDGDDAHHFGSRYIHTVRVFF